MLKTEAHKFLSEECPTSVAKEMAKDESGHSPQLWKKIAQLGWLGMIFPDQYGGGGGSYLDSVVLIEEMGAACLPSPFVPTVITGGMPILENGSEELKTEFLPNIANGEMILTFTLIDPSVNYDTNQVGFKAVASKSGYILNGTQLFVPYAHVADYMLCACRTVDGGIALLLVDSKNSGIELTPLRTVGGSKQSEVRLEGVMVPEERILDSGHQGKAIVQRIMQWATVAKCAEMAGGAQRVLEMTVQYAKQRRQFGHPIGSFQAIQHYCADMFINVDGIRFITYQAAWMLSKGIPCRKEVAMAKAWVSSIYPKITLLGHQVHGAIGYCLDHDMPLYFFQAHEGEALFGDTDFHREVVASELLGPRPISIAGGGKISPGEE